MSLEFYFDLSLLNTESFLLMQYTAPMEEVMSLSALNVLGTTYSFADIYLFLHGDGKDSPYVKITMIKMFHDILCQFVTKGRKVFYCIMDRHNLGKNLHSLFHTYNEGLFGYDLFLCVELYGDEYVLLTMNVEDMRNLSIVGYLNFGNDKGAVDDGMDNILDELK